MRLFLDSADLEEVRTAASWGVIDGITTNPSLIARSGRDLRTCIHAILPLIDGPISAECMAEDYDALVAEAVDIASWHANLVVKVPLTPVGLRCVNALSKRGIRTNVTLCFSAAQGLLAAKAGATYVSPFVGRLDDVGAAGMQLVAQLVQIYRLHGLKTQVLAASLRHSLHVVEAAMAGAQVATLPFKVLRQLFEHPLTDRGAAQFMADWRASLPTGTGA